ncbi:hypothetical protein BX666DRAFT_2026448 [Dichotomocladium elegans]|nr:hypothetical protein BX666DRAFT_2026448 [Dichotomocladium elegans]
MASSPRVKPDPEDDDLLMSYLNVDYLSASSQWPSPSPKLNIHTPPPCISWASFSSGLDPFLHPYSPSSETAAAAAAAVAAAAIPTHVSGTMSPRDTVTAAGDDASAQVVTVAAFPCYTEGRLSNRILPAIQPPALPIHRHQRHPLSPSPSSCSEDSELLPKRKRGRKKRDGASFSPPSALPAMIAPAPPIKNAIEPVLPSQKQHQKELRTATTTAAVQPQSDDDDKAAAAAKRQERLIKNRAAALLSRKRKREHVNALEEQNRRLLEENRQLLEQQQKTHSLAAMFLMRIVQVALPKQRESFVILLLSNIVIVIAIGVQVDSRHMPCLNTGEPGLLRG